MRETIASLRDSGKTISPHRVTPNLVFELPEGYIFAQQDQGGDDTLDSDVNAEGVTALFTLTVGTVNNDVDAGVVPV